MLCFVYKIPILILLFENIPTDIMFSDVTLPTLLLKMHDKLFRIHSLLQ